MKKVYFLKVTVPHHGSFYRGIWTTIEAAYKWAEEYHNEDPDSEFTIECMYVMGNMVTI